jgi:hypothetical protein
VRGGCWRTWRWRLLEAPRPSLIRMAANLVFLACTPRPPKHVPQKTIMLQLPRGGQGGYGTGSGGLVCARGELPLRCALLQQTIRQLDATGPLKQPCARPASTAAPAAAPPPPHYDML